MPEGTGNNARNRVHRGRHQRPRPRPWIRAGKNPPRYIRLGGYAGAPTAELVEFRCGWLAHSWPTGTARAMVLPPILNLADAVRTVELAEADPSAALWLPLPAPQPDYWYEYAEYAEPRGYMQRGAGKWGQQFGEHNVIVMQVTGMQGLVKFVAVVDGLVLTHGDGIPIVFDDFKAVARAGEKEIADA